MRRPTALALAVACLLGPAGPAAAQARKEAVAPPAPARRADASDRALDVVRREAEAEARKREELFAKAREVGVQPPPPLMAPIEIERLEPIAVPAPVRVVGERIIGPAVGGGIVIPGASTPETLVPMLRPALKAEYLLLVSACEPTKDQRRQIARAGEEALREAATKYTAWQRQVRVGRVNQMPSIPHPRRILEDGLAAAAKAHLSAEQQARYRDEVARRRADRRQAAVVNLVAMLDQELRLSEDQRARMAEVLSKNLDEGWDVALTQMTVGGNIPLPDHLLAPVLDRVQLRTWSALGQATFRGVGVSGSVLDAALEPDHQPLEDAELGPEPPAARGVGAGEPRIRVEFLNEPAIRKVP